MKQEIRMTEINTVLAELKRGVDEILSEADLIEKLKKTALYA